MTLNQIMQECFARAADQDLDIKDWAERADLCWQTIRRIASGTTKNPYWRTVEKMTASVGLSVQTVARAKWRKAAA